jgi:hypothetical protein
MKKEQVNFTKCKHGYAGYTVNLPIVVQAKTLEGFKAKIGKLFKHHVAELTKLAESNDPFEYVEEFLPQEPFPDSERNNLPF